VDRKYRYRAVNLPVGLADIIRKTIESDRHGYTTIPEFVKESIRRYLRELGYLK